MIYVVAAWGAVSLAAGVWFWINQRRYDHLRLRWNRIVGGKPPDGRPFLGRLFKPRPNRRIWTSLPDAFDLLGLALLAGENFERAWCLLAQFSPPGPLRRELLKSRDLLKLGRSREEMLITLKEKLAEPRANGTFALLLHSLKHGSPLQMQLFEQAGRLRREQMREAERRAQTVGIRLLFPIMIFIFPTIFLLLFGALYLSVLKNGMLF